VRKILLEAQSTLEMGGAALRIWRRIKLFKAIVLLTLMVSLILGNLSMLCIISFYSIFGLKDVDYIFLFFLSELIQTRICICGGRTMDEIT
jgi:hypothetical protein